MRAYFEVDDSSAIRILEDVETKSRSYAPVFERARHLLQGAFTANFAAQGAFSGGWSPLDPQYGAWKALHYPGAPILVRTGHLMESFADLHGGVNQIDDKEASFGTDIEYAKFHETGTSRMPARKLIFDPPGFAQILEEKIVTHLVGEGHEAAGVESVVF